MKHISFFEFIAQNPADINNVKVLEFAEKIGTGDIQVVEVDYYGFPNSEFSECFSNVEQAVKEFGGSIQYGWNIWQNYIYLDAEFHAVWRMPDGALKDVTPQMDGEKAITFVPADNRNYRGFSIKNRRYPCIDSDDVKELLDIYNSVTRPAFEIEDHIRQSLLMNIYMKFISANKS